MGKEIIEVDERTHARLVELAAEQGVTVDQYIARLVGVRPHRSSAEQAALARQTEDYLREHFDFELTPEDRAKAELWWAAPPVDAEAHGRRASA